METISPIAVGAFRQQTIDIIGYLEETEYLADCNKWSKDEVDSLCKAISELSHIIRGMLVAHEATETGCCGLCEIPWPCRVTENMYTLVKDPEKAFYDIVKQVLRRES